MLEFGNLRHPQKCHSVSVSILRFCFNTYSSLAISMANRCIGVGMSIFSHNIFDNEALRISASCSGVNLKAGFEVSYLKTQNLNF